MKVIGITGGVGSGKSRVLNYLKEERGAFICQMDETARTLQERGGICYEKILEHFGKEIVKEGGVLDRARLARLVFSDEEKLKALNDIVHPAVKERIMQEIKRERKKGTGLFVLESALLISAGYKGFCDEIWYVYADKDTRRKRLKASRGYEDKRVEDMFCAQMSEEEFAKDSDRIVDNRAEFSKTKKQVDGFLKELGIFI